MEFLHTRRRRLWWIYIKDWFIVIAMIILFFGIELVHPFHRRFSLEDKSLMYPITDESVPVWLLCVVAIIAPIVIIAIVSAAQKSVSDFHFGVLGLAVSLSLTIMLTDVIKITVGRPRPDFLDRCQPREGAVDPPLGLSTYAICTRSVTDPLLIDGFKSFISGHSSFSFAGLAYLSLYLAGKMHMFDDRGHTYKSFVFAIPLLGALLISISRIRDYRHHWTDCFIGGLVGCYIALYAYRQYYPSLFNSECHVPHRPRILMTDSDLEFWYPPTAESSSSAANSTTHQNGDIHTDPGEGASTDKRDRISNIV
ncbi:phosphatidic acid phosphatase type 2/haloperoxidase [Syncephalastrum racemosum]|uniref:Phosphatidic acid phosphatase type 2/haloperoxidase n=1 Tax=Syncephalastrum racemosum TaxID=13706 RepID=A0A1X2HHG3_SYNRA|nr:phosphatidic acid phosphatase type 2/haloperoxidase [Syncephalastrum racemosum]